VDSDVPILDYLQEMERRGEDIQEYRTIWYYF
jgi:lysine 2,3-aminomutase